MLVNDDQFHGTNNAIRGEGVEMHDIIFQI